MLNNKKAIELSVNFFVMLTISIVIFSFGLWFASRILSSGNKLVDDQMSEKNRLALDNCLQENPTCLPLNKKELHKGQTENFAFGFLNNRESTCSFRVFVELKKDKAFDADGNLIPADLIPDTDEWTFPSTDEIILENLEEYKMSVPINVPRNTKQGTYIFDVRVCSDDSSLGEEECPDSTIKYAYDRLHKIYVTVI
ncbi:hypothetical protein JXB41_07595 [Candidatus Woesearchaeota archaeon]|nr:hypothetical protein [Candidatus Woesearchaeota archaeon]